jgi:CO/xanthine dehydrogenase FAD-binding subunit
MATHTQLESSADIKRYYPILSQAASDIGSPQIRNRGTIGGNIVNASPAGDLLPALIAYRAQFKLVSHKEESIVFAEDFFLGPKKTILKPEQLLSKIIIPIPEQNTYSSWIKIGKRKALMVATVSLALVLSMAEDNKIIQEVKVCLGSVAPTPFEIMGIREKMIGRQFNQLNFNELGQLVEDRISPIDDIRGTKGYRQEVTKNIMINALEKIQETWGQSQND